MFQFVEFAETGNSTLPTLSTRLSSSGSQPLTLAARSPVSTIFWSGSPKSGSDHYAPDKWKTPLDKPYGIDAMRELWAGYLRWAEVAHNAHYKIGDL